MQKNTNKIDFAKKLKGKELFNSVADSVNKFLSSLVSTEKNDPGAKWKKSIHSEFTKYQ